jgi:protein archease
VAATQTKKMDSGFWLKNRVGQDPALRLEWDCKFMPYKYLDDIATADVAFEAWGSTREAMFIAAADATMNVMVADLDTIAFQTERSIDLQDDDIELLLFQFLQEFVYYKDAEQLLLRVKAVDIAVGAEKYRLQAQIVGEILDPGKHDLVVDVKAVTMHRFSVVEYDGLWRAAVILDI